MAHFKALLLAVVALSTGGALNARAGSAQPRPILLAQTVSDCQAKVDALRATTQSVAISGKNAAKDRATLLGAIDDAVQALQQGKYSLALNKADFFKQKVQQYASTGDITQSDANALIAAANDAITCVQSLAAAAG